MFEGHDTTAAAITWVLHVLGCHPEVQDRVVEEIRQVCGDSSEISIDQLGQLKYLECVIKETLRLYPSVPIISRRLGADSVIGGHSIPAGVQMLINIYLIHRDPAHWVDPEVFNPDRQVYTSYSSMRLTMFLDSCPRTRRVATRMPSSHSPLEVATASVNGLRCSRRRRCSPGSCATST